MALKRRNYLKIELNFKAKAASHEPHCKKSKVTLLRNSSFISFGLPFDIPFNQLRVFWE